MANGCLEFGSVRKYRYCRAIIRKSFFKTNFIWNVKLAALAQLVACLPLVQRVRGSIPGGIVNIRLKFFNLGARMGGDVHFLIARLYITVRSTYVEKAYSTVDSNSSVG